MDRLSAVVSRCTTLFLDKAGIIAKVPLALRSLPIYIVISESIVFSVASLLFLAVLPLLEPLRPTLLWWIPAYYLFMVWALALGLLMGTLTVFIRDLREFCAIMLQLWFWFTPIVYVPSILPPWVRLLERFNPIFPLVETMQAAVLGGEAASPGHLAAAALLGHLFLLFSLWLNRRLERDIRDMVC